MGLHYIASGNMDEFNALLRRFNLNSLLQRINQATAQLQMESDDSKIYGAEYVSFTVYDIRTKTPQKLDIIMTGWNLIDLAYEAICATNEFRGITEITDDQFHLLISSHEAVSQKKEECLLEAMGSNKQQDLLIYLWGFFGEQAKVQALARVFENTSRELYMLFHIGKEINGLTNIDTLIKQITDVSWVNILTILLIIWFKSTKTAKLSEIKHSIIFNKDFSEQDFEKVTKLYTASLDEVKTSPLQRQFLYTKPYIATKKNGTLSISCYLNLFLYEHSLLWILRDYYNYEQNGNRIFTSKFGECFESYFSELLQCYLAESDYFKIPEEKESRADWKIKIGSYYFLVEQKSTVLGLNAKQQASNIETIKKFCQCNVFKALKQLKTTEDAFHDHRYIKVVLLYEDYLQSDILDSVFSMTDCPVSDDGHYWMSSIYEFEMLLACHFSDPSLFTTFVETKLERDYTKENTARSILLILRELGITENTYLKQEKFSYYHNLIAKNAALHTDK